MARLSDSPDSTIPQPELNPLLNPLLSRNLGRWAEVYFTNPPERREEAVQELLQRLRREVQSPQSGSLPTTPIARDGSGVSPTESLPVVPCPACGSENAPENRFCGMCGTSLRLPNKQADPRMVAAESLAEPSADPGPARQPELAFPTPIPESLDRVARERQDEIPASHFPMDNEYLRKLREANDSDRFELSLESSSLFSQPHLRISIGAVLLIAIGALGYAVWRGSDAWSRTQPAVRQPAVEAANPPVEPQTPPAAPAPVDAAGPAVSAVSHPSPAAGKSEAVGSRPVGAVQAAALREGVSGAPLIPAASGNGAPELAMAMSYLDPAQGRTRDSSEGSKWLWKSVGKHNLEATLLLSDLYLRGDGVSKSCDQARVLLDAAARKNSRAAAERLRDLEAFGCR